MSEVLLTHVESVLEELSYPIARDDASDELEGTTLLLANGEVDLGDLIEKSDSESFESENDLESELNNVLPREAVGEPYQSEGEG
ncbi:hypothetical protein OB955_20975 [Halobacteria archaeon AArc-m2/3/4]|uniref:DUF2795 domain-containing protein n=1 Tax=Natronoglomus mannanivorans TaxID=2979990 RepID=A0AAP2YZX5_9EURY|nr:hypothetical protein [Halobacteria archaeon AArc-xg1-1]MCU4975177.1 hypothetical protein [Halobacteria archaeon AArc-m2/3/4]